MADYLHGNRTQFMDQNQDPIELLDASIVGVIGWGGDPAKFPYGIPTLVNSTSQLSDIPSGSLRTAILDMWKQGPCLSVVINVEHSDDDAELKSNLIGVLDNDTGLMTGMKAFMRSEQEAGKRPRILICPEVQDIDVAKALDSIGKKYNAIPIVESKGTGFAEHNAFKNQLDQVMVISGGVKYFDAATSSVVESGGSATAAGIMVRTDNKKGFAKSPSNEFALECRGPVLPIDYTPGSLTCLANVYNSESMTVFANMKGGVKLWGSRLANGKMIQKERVRLIIADSINLETQDIVDGNITIPFCDKLTERLQNFLDRMTLDLVISGGRCWIPKEINIASIGLDKFYVDYSVGYYDSAEQVTYRQYTDNTFTEKVFS